MKAVDVRALGLRWIACATCGYPASCLRSSEVNVGEPACDTCCGHDPNDVVCVPLEDVDPEALKAFEEVGP